MIKKINIFLFILAVSFYSCTKEQDENIEYRILNGNIGTWDSSTIITNDDHLACIGYLRNDSTERMQIVKFNRDGNEIFSKQFHNNHSRALGFAQDSFGNYYVSGYSEDVDQSNKRILSVAKLDNNGDEIWRKSFPNENEITGYHATILNANEIIISATSISEMVLLKIDTSGNLLNFTRTDEGFIAGPNNTIKIDENHFMVTANQSTRAHLFYFDSNLNLIWKKAVAPNGTFGRSTILTKDGNLLTCGHYTHADSSNAIEFQTAFILKSTKGGERIWFNEIGNTDYLNDAQSIKEKPDGSLVMTGYALQSEIVNEMWKNHLDHFIFYTNSSGEEIDLTYYRDDQAGRGANIISLNEERNIITGNHNEGTYILNIDNHGNN